MNRLIGLLIGAAIIFLASDCHAQRHRGLFKRGARVQQYERQYQPRHQNDQFFSSAHSQRFRHPATNRNSDWRFQSYNTTEAYPKYIGGFHASQIYNIGIPSGDIGFRGNGIYWTPW